MTDARRIAAAAAAARNSRRASRFTVVSRHGRTLSRRSAKQARQSQQVVPLSRSLYLQGKRQIRLACLYDYRDAE